MIFCIQLKRREKSPPKLPWRDGKTNVVALGAEHIDKRRLKHPPQLVKELNSPSGGKTS